MRRETFIVEIIENQRQTWQGRIHWVQENKKETFRSVLEMLHLMDSAISANDEDGTGEE